MKVKIINKHKSVYPPCEFELPNFSVLTGKNGSGKTHLLEAIANEKTSEVSINGRITKRIRYIGFNGLNPNISEMFDPQTIVNHSKNSWSNYDGQIKRLVLNEPQNVTLQRLQDYHGDPLLTKYIDKILQDTKKSIDQLTEDDFVDSFDISLLGQNDFFTAQFAAIFKSYHKRQEENNLNNYYTSKGKESLKPVLSDEEFEAKFGKPPWDFVNKILVETNIPYEVNSPVGTRLESNFIFKLKDRSQGFEISSMDLSTGEKVLMSLALAIYNTGGDSGKPDILLLDEPDAGLHPSMSKMMVNILNKNIVSENKIPAIISTHSPTTIIASEGISIYQMSRGNSIPFKIPMQQAIEILSSDIPFLKISTEKRRQVFVESKYDVNYYELLTNILARKETLNAEPIYVAARTTSGSNCSDVIEVVKSLSRNGNDQVYGIIDWDTVNSSDEKLIVLGENDRYAIENYLLDPLLVGLLCIREMKLNFTYFDLTSYSNYSDIANLTQHDAQKIIQKVLDDIKLVSTNTKSSTLHNGWNMALSQEFNKHNGHALELLYKSTYPFLSSYRREDGLKKDIIEKVINDYPDFTPTPIFDAIRKIK